MELSLSSNPPSGSHKELIQLLTQVCCVMIHIVSQPARGKHHTSLPPLATLLEWRRLRSPSRVGQLFRFHFSTFASEQAGLTFVYVCLDSPPTSSGSNRNRSHPSITTAGAIHCSESKSLLRLSSMASPGSSQLLHHHLNLPGHCSPFFAGFTMDPDSELIAVQRLYQAALVIKPWFPGHPACPGRPA